MYIIIYQNHQSRICNADVQIYSILYILHIFAGDKLAQVGKIIIITYST